MIEEASWGDAESILSVINTSNREAFQCIVPQEHLKTPILSLLELQELMGRMPFFVYTSENRIIGVAALSVEGGETGWLQWVYVLPECQRKGVGKALVDHLENLAREKGLSRLQLFAAGTAIWVIEFYQKLGYRITGKIDRPWGFDVVMGRDIGA